MTPRLFFLGAISVLIIIAAMANADQAGTSRDSDRVSVEQPALPSSR